MKNVGDEEWTGRKRYGQPTDAGTINAASNPTTMASAANSMTENSKRLMRDSMAMIQQLRCRLLPRSFGVQRVSQADNFWKVCPEIG